MWLVWGAARIGMTTQRRDKAASMGGAARDARRLRSGWQPADQREAGGPRDCAAVQIANGRGDWKNRKG